MKLKAAPPLLGAAPSVLSYAARDEHGHGAATEPWRKWYKSAAWQRLRRRVFKRDGYVCQRSGVICAGQGQDWNAPVANHKVPHRGNPDLFWDESNIETVTKQVHDGVIQAEEARARAAGEV